MEESKSSGEPAHSRHREGPTPPGASDGAPAALPSSSSSTSTTDNVRQWQGMEEIQVENQAFIDATDRMYPEDDGVGSDDDDDGDGDGDNQVTQDFLAGLISSDPADSAEISSIKDHLDVGDEEAEFLAVRGVWWPAEKGDTLLGVSASDGFNRGGELIAYSEASASVASMQEELADARKAVSEGALTESERTIANGRVRDLETDEKLALLEAAYAKATEDLTACGGSGREERPDLSSVVDARRKDVEAFRRRVAIEARDRLVLQDVSKILAAKATAGRERVVDRAFLAVKMLAYYVETRALDARHGADDGEVRAGVERHWGDKCAVGGIFGVVGAAASTRMKFRPGTRRDLWSRDLKLRVDRLAKRGYSNGHAVCLRALYAERDVSEGAASIPLCGPGTDVEGSAELPFPIVDDMVERYTAARELAEAREAVSAAKKIAAAAAAASAAAAAAAAAAPPTDSSRGRRHSAPAAASRYSRATGPIHLGASLYAPRSRLVFGTVEKGMGDSLEALSAELEEVSVQKATIPLYRPGTNVRFAAQMAFPVVDSMVDRRAAERTLDKAREDVAAAEKTSGAVAPAESSYRRRRSASAAASRATGPIQLGTSLLAPRSRLVFNTVEKGMGEPFEEAHKEEEESVDKLGRLDRYLCTCPACLRKKAGGILVDPLTHINRAAEPNPEEKARVDAAAAMRSSTRAVTELLAKLPQNTRLSLEPGIAAQFTAAVHALKDAWAGFARAFACPTLPDSAVAAEPLRVTMAATRKGDAWTAWFFCPSCTSESPPRRQHGARQHMGLGDCGEQAYLRCPLSPICTGRYGAGLYSADSLSNHFKDAGNTCTIEALVSGSLAATTGALVALSEGDLVMIGDPRTVRPDVVTKASLFFEAEEVHFFSQHMWYGENRERVVETGRCLDPSASTQTEAASRDQGSTAAAPSPGPCSAGNATVATGVRSGGGDAGSGPSASPPTSVSWGGGAGAPSCFLPAVAAGAENEAPSSPPPRGRTNPSGVSGTAAVGGGLGAADLSPTSPPRGRQRLALFADKIRGSGPEQPAKGAAPLVRSPAPNKARSYDQWKGVLSRIGTSIENAICVDSDGGDLGDEENRSGVEKRSRSIGAHSSASPLSHARKK